MVKRPAAYSVFRNAFFISGTIGIIIFVLYPVAPPRLADVGVVDTVTMYSSSYRVLQPPAFVNQYAAVPSLHFGWDLLMGIALVTQSRWRVRRDHADADALGHRVYGEPLHLRCNGGRTRRAHGARYRVRTPAAGRRATSRGRPNDAAAVRRMRYTSNR